MAQAMIGDIPHLERIPENWRKGDSPWRDISSAPKDGTPILCFYGNGYGMRRYSVRYWSSGTWGNHYREEWVDEWRQIRNAQPTHWMPLPPPPVVEEK